MNKKILLAVSVIVLVGIVGYIALGKKSILIQQSQSNSLQNTQPITSTTGVQTSPNLIQCGNVNQKILTQYNYQPTEAEKEATIKSLTCINQALVNCASASLEIDNASQITNVTVNGQGKLGCSVAVKKHTGETMTCPLSSDYITEVQKQFTASNYNATIVNKLITDINAEISSGNKSGNCTVTK